MTETKTTPKVSAAADVVKSDAAKAPEVKKEAVDLTKAPTEPPHADAGKGSEVSPEDQKAIDAALGDHNEGPDDDDDAPKPATTREQAQARAEVALKNFRKAAKGIPASTPDDHPLWGNSSGSIKVGDLRALLSVLPNVD